MMPMPSNEDLRVPLLCSGGKTPCLGSTFGNFARVSSHRNREEEPVETCPRPKKALDSVGPLELPRRGPFFRAQARKKRSFLSPNISVRRDKRLRVDQMQ